MKIVSLLPAASEMLCDLGVIDNINAVSHECNYPKLLKEKVQITSSNIPNNIEQKLIDDLVSEAIKNKLPLYNIDTDKLNEYMKRGVIEIAPLAYMRGRTLDDAFVILDEGQNTTHNQMKMFLTRMGVNAKFMINGDPGQIDLPRRVISGLKEANLVLKNIEGIKMIYLDDSDVIRHPVVKRIIKAYKNTEHTN